MAGRQQSVELAEYPKVGGTDAGAYHLLESGILVAIPRPGYRQTVDGARTSLQELVRISEELGEALVVLVLLDPVRDQDRGSRQVWTEETDLRFMRGLGLVGVSPLARALGSFFMGLTRPKVPTALLADLEAGLRWARSLKSEATGGDAD